MLTSTRPAHACLLLPCPGHPAVALQRVSAPWGVPWIGVVRIESMRVFVWLAFPNQTKSELVEAAAQLHPLHRLLGFGDCKQGVNASALSFCNRALERTA